ncbi:MAG: hypothetical protein JWL64_870, partial [Frankiales bacterium]|nr:hypothetical protein [Frankiales bacterium]
TLLADDPATALLAAGQEPAAVAAAHPTSSAAWAALAEAALAGTTSGAESTGRVIEGYAYARTGYHRGLDALRRAGWKGFGPVPWEHAPNQGFLRALHALGRATDLIGEQEEAARIQAFLNESDPAVARLLG